MKQKSQYLYAQNQFIETIQKFNSRPPNVLFLLNVRRILSLINLFDVCVGKNDSTMLKWA